MWRARTWLPSNISLFLSKNSRTTLSVACLLAYLSQPQIAGVDRPQLRLGEHQFFQNLLVRLVRLALADALDLVAHLLHAGVDVLGINRDAKLLQVLVDQDVIDKQSDNFGSGFGVVGRRHPAQPALHRHLGMGWPLTVAATPWARPISGWAGDGGSVTPVGKASRGRGRGLLGGRRCRVRERQRRNRRRQRDMGFSPRSERRAEGRCG
jgi:hypothetical protein